MNLLYNLISIRILNNTNITGQRHCWGYGRIYVIVRGRGKEVCAGDWLYGREP